MNFLWKWEESRFELPGSQTSNRVELVASTVIMLVDATYSANTESEWTGCVKNSELIMWKTFPSVWLNQHLILFTHSICDVKDVNIFLLNWNGLHLQVTVRTAYAIVTLGSRVMTVVYLSLQYRTCSLLRSVMCQKRNVVMLRFMVTASSRVTTWHVSINPLR